MFWKFGFHNTSSIDALLDNEDIALESLFGEDDLLQECKAQNARLVEYFQKSNVLQQLMGYVTGRIIGEGDGRFKYPHLATEVLCSDIWSIVETCLNNAELILTPFWNAVLDRSPADMRAHNIMTSQFAKINAIFLGKKPAEMLSFIKAQPSVVERLLQHIEMPALVDLLMRIIQCDGHETSTAVLDWLSAERFIPQLVDMLSPAHSETVHSVASELIKGIISISAPSPGAGVADSADNSLASNLFARQLAQRENIEKLVNFTLDGYSNEASEDRSKLINVGQSPSLTEFSDTLSAERRTPNVDNIISSGVHSISIIIDLIRKNNSDYWEPYLFHTIRNRLINAQQHLRSYSGDTREFLEITMKELSDRLGVVHLGPLLEIMCDRLEQFEKLLLVPRSDTSPLFTTIGSLVPLTLERFRICELYAELLHCSNMALLNRPVQFDHLYDSEGRLKGGLAALEQLGRIVTIGSDRHGQDPIVNREDEMEPAQELPVSSASASSPINSDEDGTISDDEDEHISSDDDVMEEISMGDDQPEHVSPVVPSSPNGSSSPSSSIRVSPRALLERTRRLSSTSASSDSLNPRYRQRSTSSRSSIYYSSSFQKSGSLTIGDKFKQKMQETGLLNTVTDLFFSFPWNNFLHSVVYDLLHQILTGRTDSGLNRELIFSLFRDAQLPYKIIAGQRCNDIESSKRKGFRLGYMGHLTLLSEDIINAMEHYPPDIRLLLAQYAPQPEWDDYVSGRYHETKKRDTSLLGGGKPAVTSNNSQGPIRWRVDEEDNVDISEQKLKNEKETPEMIGQFRRTSKLSRESSADFGPVKVNEAENSSVPHFAHYLAQEISSTISIASDGSDEEEEEGGWLTQSKFDIGPPPVSARNHSPSRRPLSSTEFDESFNPSNGQQLTGNSPFDDQFVDDDDHFGPFSDAAATSDNNHFILSGSDDAEDSVFDSFGEFGEFHAADGRSTPTGDSWTFASDIGVSSGSDEGDDIVMPSRDDL